MSDQDKKKKKDPTKVFFEELSKSPLTITLLAIITGLILGGLLVAGTSEDVYAAFGVSFWEGIKASADAAWTTYVALFYGSVGNPTKITAALQSGDAEAIRRAFNPFFESLVASTPYIFAGLAVALGFRVGLTVVLSAPWELKPSARKGCLVCICLKDILQTKPFQ